jgi:hypothetical protein
VPITTTNASVSDVTTTTARVRITPGTTTCTATKYTVGATIAGESKNVTLPRPKLSISKSGVTIDITGLAPGKTYTLSIAGICSSGVKSAMLPPLKFTTAAAATADYAPTVALLNTTKTTMTVKITAPKAGCKPVSYILRRSIGGDKSVVQTVKGSTASYQLTGLTPGRTYEVTAIGVCSDGTKTLKSNGLFVETQADIPPVQVSFIVRTSGSTIDQIDDKVKAGICEQLLANVDYPKGKAQQSAILLCRISSCLTMHLLLHAADLVSCVITGVRKVDIPGRRLQQTSTVLEVEGRLIFLVISNDLQTIAVENAEDVALVLENLEELEKLLNIVLPDDVKVISGSSNIQQENGCVHCPNAFDLYKSTLRAYKWYFCLNAGHHHHLHLAPHHHHHLLRLSQPRPRRILRLHLHQGLHLMLFRRPLHRHRHLERKDQRSPQKCSWQR